MIQDIQPHIFNNHYEVHEPEGSDAAVCIEQGRVLLKNTGSKMEFPKISEIEKITGNKASDFDNSYLFSIDKTRFFMLEEKRLFDAEQGRLPESYEWKTQKEVREINPKLTAFEAVTAMQLERWYKNNIFCGKCGKKLVRDKHERMLRCPECTNMIYPRINPAVIIAVTNGEKLLMTKYNGRTYTKYALVAGFTEIGETLEETVSREVMEETGLKVKNIRYYKSQPWSFSDTILMGFFCEVDGSDEIILDREELSVGEWIDRKNISQVQESYDSLSLTNEMIEYFCINGYKY